MFSDLFDIHISGKYICRWELRTKEAFSDSFELILLGKIPPLSYSLRLIITLWTLKLLAHMNRFVMFHKIKSLLLDDHTLNIEISGPYGQLFDEIQ